MDRFIVVRSDEARQKGYPEAHQQFFHGDLFWCLYETDGEKPIRLVADDGGEPEDQLLVRNLRWVPIELNNLAEQLAKRERYVEAAFEEALKLREEKSPDAALLFLSIALRKPKPLTQAEQDYAKTLRKPEKETL